MEQFMHSTTYLDSSGDTTIVWTPENDDNMEKIIEEKMKQGVTFFIVKPRAFGLLPPERIKLEHPRDARSHRAMSISDEDLKAFVMDGSGQVVETPPVPTEPVTRAKTAKEAAGSQTVAVKQAKGG